MKGERNMTRIMASVGNRGVNRRNDVVLVQQLLNKHKIPLHHLLLKIDGIAGSKTIKQITGFQKHMMKIRVPDGRVDPNGRTIRALDGMMNAASNATKGKNLYNLSLEKAALRAKMEKYEGKINHMYLDSKGFVTVGVGHLLKNLSIAQKLNFKKNNNMPASMEEIKADYEAVKKQPKNRLASFYKAHTKLKLSELDINTLTNKHIDNFEAELKRIFSDFSTYPSEVKLALFDIIFNVGMTDLNNKWPNFKKAVKAKDWANAAKESNRKSPISAERNKYVKDLFEKAAANAKK
jgi:GH24 family phage-related lysozyme (muramidase)